MKNILVLGAGIYQVPLIKKIKEMGYKAIVCSIEGNYPGFIYADKIYKVDTTDYESCLTIAEKESVCGVCTSGTDVALRSIGYICEHLNLPGISYETAVLCTDKKKMKESFEKAKVKTPKFKICESEIDVKKNALSLEYPLIMKIVDSSGSRGIERINNPSELSDVYTRISKITHKPYVILEEYIEGNEFGAQALVVNGKIIFCMPHGDILYKGKTNVPIGHYVPFILDEKVYSQVLSELLKSIEALKIKNAFLNIDMIEKDGKIYIIEIGARAGATCLPELVSHHYGIDCYKIIVSLATNSSITENFIEKNPCAAFLLYSEQDGTIQNIDITKAKQHKNLLEISIDYSVGDKINRFKVGPDRIGQYIVSGDSVEDVLTSCNSIRNNVYIDVK